MKYKKKINELKTILVRGLLEKEEAISLLLLCMIAGKSVFLFGPPGVAKSLIARRVSCAFESNNFFDYLMSKFSAPEEIFGPLKISELKQDKLVRDIEGFLPDCDFAFLDEIWKSSPAILNALLTIINEKKFRNGKVLIDVPLNGLISASNEMPQKDAGLEALYDRFAMRLNIKRLDSEKSFEALLNNTGIDYFIDIDKRLKFSNDEIKKIKEDSKQVKIDSAVMETLKMLRKKLQEYDLNASKNNVPIIDVSERRWVTIMEILKVSAILNDRKNVILPDVVLIKYCLYNNQDQIKFIENLLKECIKSNNIKLIVDKEEFSTLKSEIENNITYTHPIHKLEHIDGKSFITFKFNIHEEEIIIYAPTISIKDKKYYACYVYENNEFVQSEKMSCLFDMSKNRCYFRINDAIKQNGWNSTPNERFLDFKMIENEILSKISSPKIISVKLQNSLLKKCDAAMQNITILIKNTEQEEKDFIENGNCFMQEHDYDVFLHEFLKYKEELEELFIECKKLKYIINHAKIE